MSSHVAVEQQRLTDIFNLRNGTLQIKRFAQDDLEDLLCWSVIAQDRRTVWSWICDLLDVDAMAGAAEDQACSHGLREPFGLVAS